MPRDRRVYRQVAQLHIDCIDQGFLPQLGADFLTLMYECLDEDPGALLLTCERDGDVVGFVTSAGSLGGVYRRMLGRWRRLAPALGPSLVRPRRVLRILEILRYSAAHPADAALPASELLSLAVAPAWRGKGCAEELYQGLVRELTQRGERAFKIVVGAPLAPAHRFYRRMGAEPAAEIEVHRGEASTVYVHHLA
ncbi:GNAT family N-acetyltransferase [Phenylobacterium sp.]|jgi:ribosomal protein S18 acetylase RimI-like enzyme|uniref:GNAT family N-acetyltransferase n=1 Tax=Phenylobacterium sp. TaxID=1871053 RepID=UPI002F943905